MAHSPTPSSLMPLFHLASPTGAAPVNRASPPPSKPTAPAVTPPPATSMYEEVAGAQHTSIGALRRHGDVHTYSEFAW